MARCWTIVEVDKRSGALAEVAVMAQPPLTSTERLACLYHQLTFFGAMAPIAVKYIGRAQSRRAVGQLGLLTDRC